MSEVTRDCPTCKNPVIDKDNQYGNRVFTGHGQAEERRTCLKCQSYYRIVFELTPIKCEII
jgi:hypothetical protein